MYINIYDDIIPYRFVYTQIYDRIIDTNISIHTWIGVQKQSHTQMNFQIYVSIIKYISSHL